MLYDPKWNAKTDPFTLEGLIAWLEKQPASEAYYYEQSGRCLIAQYLTAMGFEKVSVGPFTYRHSPDREDRKPLPFGWDNTASNKPHTFGAALERARKMLPQ